MDKFNKTDIQSVSMACTTLYIWSTAIDKF